MTGIVQHAITVFLGFFAMMNPIANTPIFISLTEDDDRRTTHMVALRALLIAFGTITVFSVLGNLIFRLFSITLYAFRLTGGLLIFVIGYQMLHGSHSTVHQLSKEQNRKSMEARLSVAVSPLAMPILAGPGTIATAINFSTSHSIEALAVTLGAFALLSLITYFFFLFGEKMVNYIGEAAISVVTRLMGLILATIGVQMVIEGIKGAFGLT